GARPLHDIGRVHVRQEGELAQVVIEPDELFFVVSDLHAAGGRHLEIPVLDGDLGGYEAVAMRVDDGAAWVAREGIGPVDDEPALGAVQEELHLLTVGAAEGDLFALVVNIAESPLKRVQLAVAQGDDTIGANFRRKQPSPLSLELLVVRILENPDDVLQGSL